MTKAVVESDVSIICRPDWQHRWTASEFEEELSPLKFQGPGLYISNTDVLLVGDPSGDLPAKVGSTSWKKHWVLCWNGTDVLKAFTALTTIQRFFIDD